MVGYYFDSEMGQFYPSDEPEEMELEDAVDVLENENLHSESKVKEAYKVVADFTFGL